MAFAHLQIYDRRERWLVGCADAFLGAWAVVSRRPPLREAGAPTRILLLRLERIGDLLMTLEAINRVRVRAPGALLHLVVGSWNASLARILPDVDSYETLDASWLARTEGQTALALARRAWSWRKRAFDLALNFEPDIRSNTLLGLSGAPRRVGFASGGGGGLLTTALPYVPELHTAINALRIVDAALPSPTEAAHVEWPVRLSIPEEARREANRLLGGPIPGRLLVGVHPSAGRAIKQWHLNRFGQVAARLASDFGATVVLTGTREDRPLVDAVVASLSADVPRLDLAGPLDLSVFAAVLQQLRLLVTCDSGPMHLAAAVGTPVVGLFGPADPRRWGPLTPRARVLAANLWCRPCNRVRRPPLRCAGRVPDCLDGISADAVCRAAADLLRDPAP
jgi:ADP-heptose:LPS heptosyltransferase